MGLELRDEIHDGSGIHVAQFVWLKLVETSAVNSALSQNRTWAELIKSLPNLAEKSWVSVNRTGEHSFGIEKQVNISGRGL
jgi:hypothetical protein